MLRAMPSTSAGAARRPRAREWIVAAGLAAALLGFLATQYSGALGLPLMTDDYLILGKVRDASFASLWSATDLLSGFYRPWARELHYWTLHRLFGAHPLPYHLACFLLWLGIMALCFALVRRLAGTATAALATCLAATQAAWGSLLVWPAGSQDLWMMLLGLASLAAFAGGRLALSTTALALALLSKETAATLPAIAALHAWIVERRSPAAALRRSAALWAVAAAWALVHPMLGGRLWHGTPAAVATPSSDLLARLALSLRQVVNADLAARPADGWPQALIAATPAALLLAAAVLVGFRAEAGAGGAGPMRATRGRVAAWGAAWALLGWLPLLMPGIRWHPYYALWGGLGAATALAAGLARWRALALAAVIGLALLRTARAWTPQAEQAGEWYLARAAVLTETVRRDLLDHHATLPSHSRVFLAGVPGGVGLIPSPGHCPALEVWYGDRTLRGYFYSQYAPRAARDTLGRDFFFVFDASGRSTEVVRGPEDLERARQRPDWLPRQLELAALLFTRGDPAACADEFEKMTRAFPDDPSLRFALGACRELMGDLAGAERSYRQAFALPGATPEMLAIARRDWGTAP